MKPARRGQGMKYALVRNIAVALLSVSDKQLSRFEGTTSLPAPPEWGELQMKRAFSPFPGREPKERDPALRHDSGPLRLASRNN